MVSVSPLLLLRIRCLHHHRQPLSSGWPLPIRKLPSGGTPSSPVELELPQTRMMGFPVPHSHEVRGARAASRRRGKIVRTPHPRLRRPPVRRRLPHRRRGRSPCNLRRHPLAPAQQSRVTTTGRTRRARTTTPMMVPGGDPAAEPRPSAAYGSGGASLSFNIPNTLFSVPESMMGPRRWRWSSLFTRQATRTLRCGAFQGTPLLPSTAATAAAFRWTLGAGTLTLAPSARAGVSTMTRNTAHPITVCPASGRA